MKLDPELTPEIVKIMNKYQDLFIGEQLGKTKSGELHHLDAFCRQTTVVEMVRWLYDLYERFRDSQTVCRFYMEANFVQDIILDEFRREGVNRGCQLPIIPDKRKKPDKFQRIEAVSPLWERGFVYYNAHKRNDPDMNAGLDQTLAVGEKQKQIMRQHLPNPLRNGRTLKRTEMTIICSTALQMTAE